MKKKTCTFGFFKAFVGIFASASTLAVAGGFYGNQSDIHWKTAGSDHFQFYYPSEYSSHAAKVSAYAEAVYDSVVSRYRPLPSRVDVSLSNSLYSNGSAVPSENALNLWLTNWDFKIRSSHGWMSDVVTHEFSHLVSIESGSKVNPHLYGLQLSYTDYYNERITSDFATMIPFTTQPLWLAEGTAQYESSRMGFDGWDTHRDMLLRVAALNDDLLSLEYMHDFSDNSLYAELGPYTQGFALVRYISEHYGEDALPRIWGNFAKPYRVTLDGALKATIGIGEEELYENWKKEITDKYKAQKDSLGELVEGIKLTEESFWQDFPVVAGKNLYGVSNFGGLWFDGSVFKVPLRDSVAETRDERRETREVRDSVAETRDERRETREVRDSSVAVKDSSASLQDSSALQVGVGDIEVEGADSALLNIGDYAKCGFKAKKPWFDKGIDVFDDSTRGPVLAYISYQNRDKDGHAHFDVALSDTSKNELTLTYLADAVYPAIDKQGTWVAFVRREPYSTRFVLSKVPFPKDLTDYTAEDPTDLYIPDTAFTYYNIYSPKFSPDGKRIAFGYFDDKVRGIAVIDSDGKNFKVVSNSSYDERDVNWIDNDKIVFASNRNGIFNLIEKSLSTGVEHPLTNVVGGAFTPVLEGDTIFYTNYDKDGFSLYKLPYNPSREIVLKGSLPQKVVKEIELSEVEFAGIEKDYKPIPTVPLFVPLIAFAESAPDLTVFGDGQLKLMAGLAAMLSDPLKKNTVQLGLLWQLDNITDFDGSDREFFASWENRSTPLDLGLSYSYTYSTSMDTVRYEDVAGHGGDSLGTSHYAVSSQAIAATAGYSIFKSIDTLTISAGYDWADFNLYEDQFEWTYQKRLSATAAFGLYGDNDGESSEISGQGNGLTFFYQFSNSDLYRPGTFAESFTITSSGVVKPNYRNFTLHEFGLNLYGSLQSPFTGARLAAGGKVSGILKWHANSKNDTLDSYYYSPVFLEGYPYLRSSEDYTLAGTKTAMAEVHYLFPIYDDWRKHFWIFSTRSFYFDLFAQIGAAWNGKWIDTDKFTDHRFWDRDVGVSFRISNKIFYSVPLDISLTLARGLSRIGENSDLTGGKKLTPIDVPLLPDCVSPTKIKFAIGMGFSNSWQ